VYESWREVAMKSEGSEPRNRYILILQKIFDEKYKPGDTEVPFSREDIVSTAEALGLERPKNLGDLLYSFRFRSKLPDSITEKAPPGQAWAIKPRGKALYALVLSPQIDLRPRSGLSITRIPDATPGIIALYALGDEQALLAKIRYNRLLDIFTGVACYSLQSHLRTATTDVGQIETDEVYVGIDVEGIHYVFPVQAKRNADHHNLVQIETDLAMCKAKFPGLRPIPISAQFLDSMTIALFRFKESSEGLSIADERHYRLIPADQFTPEELARFQGTRIGSKGAAPGVKKS
jgi:hypothetical protein